MTALQIYFQGRYYVDPPTANNNLIDNLIDVNRVDLTNYWRSLSDEQLFSSLTSLEKKLRPQLDGQPAIIDELPSYWNYYGTHGFWFDEVMVRGSNVPELADDPLIGTPVSLQGTDETDAVMVQIDPTGSTSAQVFSDLLCIGKNGCLLTGMEPSVAYLRQLHVPRNLQPIDFPQAASGVFQSVVMPDKVQFDNELESALLQQLADGLSQGLCLKLFYNLYFTSPPAYTSPELAEAYSAGERPHNPRQGQVVGFLTLAEPTSFPSIPSGRLLQATELFDFRNRQKVPLGPTLVDVDEKAKQLHLNLSSTIPERDHTLEKLNLGDGYLQLVDVSGEVQTVGKIGYEQYNKQAYEASAGQISLPIPSELIDKVRNGRLQLSFQHADQFGGNPMVTEVAYDIQTENRCVYFYTDEPQIIQVYVSRFGQPVQNISVAVGQWRRNMIDAGARSAQKTQPEFGHTLAKGYTQRVLTIAPPVAVTDSDGIATFTLAPHSLGVARLYFWLPEHQSEPTDTSELAMGRLSYATARVFPTHQELDDISDPDWQSVYDNVLRYFNFVYAGMNDAFVLSDEEAIKAQAQQILANIDRQKWYSTNYIPASRELTIGRENLLRRWLEKVVSNQV